MTAVATPSLARKRKRGPKPLYTYRNIVATRRVNQDDVVTVETATHTVDDTSLPDVVAAAARSLVLSAVFAPRDTLTIIVHVQRELNRWKWSDDTPAD